MRGIGYALSRLPFAKAVLAGAAIIVGALASPANGQAIGGNAGEAMPGSGNGNGTETADAPRGEEAAWSPAHLWGGGPVQLPRPLQPSDAAVLRRVFALQARGNIPEAIKAAAQSGDSLLTGTILADRYLGRHYASTVAELTDWLAHYGDHADAPAVYDLLVRKAPKGTPLPQRPVATQLAQAAEPERPPEESSPGRSDMMRDPVLDRAVQERAERGSIAAALRMITMRAHLSPAYAAQLRAEVAQVQFTRNEDVGALRIARLAVRDLPPGSQPALAFYVAGLAAWRMGDPQLALSMFESGAGAGVTTPQLQAASAFWASRAARRLHDASAAMHWLHEAVGQPLTLHGFLARRLLHLPTGIVPSGQLVSQADIDAVAATPQGLRAFALLQVGQTEKAEAELRTLWPLAQANPAFGRSLLLVVSYAGLTDCAARMAGLLQAADGLRHDELRFPLPRLRPAGGFRIDPALVYALTRLESNFDSGAVSAAGARGLMQIMPATAQWLMGETPLQPARLHEPATNLELGQRYVNLLSRLDGVDGDLIRLLASYNCGPGSMQRWSADIRDNGDPLLFIEAIPLAETRAFVRTALVYSWIYAARLHLPAPSLDSLAAGEFPRFAPHGFTTAPLERKMASAAPVLH